MSQFLGACGTVFVGVGFLCAPFAAGVTYVFVRAGAPDPWAASIGIGAAAGVAAAFILVGLFHLRYRSATDVYHEQYKHLLRRLQSAQHRRAAIHVAKRSPRGQLVGSRNNMMLAAAVAGVIAYLALISVIVWKIDPKALQVAASFVMTGTLISLLHQVTLVGSREGGVADFGQSTARLLSASFVSGLIALLGVVVLEGINLSVNGQPLLQSFEKWRQTFDWTLDKSGFFWAAAFGLTPSWLFQLLQNRTDAIKNSLNASRATSGT